MVAVALKCPFCGSEDVHPYGTSNVTVNSRPVRERCSKGGGQSNRRRKGHTEYAQREFELMLRRLDIKC
jgi:transposase-like protein